MEYDKEQRSCNFLDTTVWIDPEGFLQTDLFTKPCAKIQYLLPTSGHPNSIFSNIPYSLMYRLKRICSQEEGFDRRIEELKGHLLNRGYNHHIIKSAKAKIDLVTREEALKRVVREPNKRKCFVTEYHPSLPSMGKILRKHWAVMVERDGRLRECFPQPSMVAYKKGKSLKDLLCRAQMPTVARRSLRQQQKQGFSWCGLTNHIPCVLCPYTRNAKQHSVAGRTFQINGVITCETKGCVYKIECQRCPGFVYYGETGRALKTRFREHKGDIENCRDKPVAEHFNLPGHSLADLVFTGIERVMPPGDSFMRKQRESFYIMRSNSVRDGANRRF